ncbi:group II truncated hemoglobin [Novosphingobium sp. TH158]|uniref:group II truncated hemoglobin n=1 Tax=Novosphingobium sp. TH158 TaxID=2067455 RepID=UPI000C7E00F2|nr:group II truncated hemoglobin [Novosphingobium sp. TH158]PLK27188.1 globin [Novosphingobium sp. TH158]
MNTAVEEKPAPTTPYERLGGLPVLEAISNRFYDLMDQDPAYAELRAMHSPDLSRMRTSLAQFLMGWSGGPRDWFEANPGRCMMSVHKPYAISADVAGQWADAMNRAVHDTLGESDPPLAKEMARVLDQLARSMGR